MKNLLDIADIKFRFISSYAFTTHHELFSRCEEYKIDRITNTPQRSDGSFGKTRYYYYMDDCKKEYTNLEELVKDWNEIKNFDDPNSEIIWTKKIIKKVDGMEIIIDEKPEDEEQSNHLTTVHFKPPSKHYE